MSPSFFVQKIEPKVMLSRYADNPVRPFPRIFTIGWLAPSVIHRWGRLFNLSSERSKRPKNLHQPICDRRL